MNQKSSLNKNVFIATGYHLPYNPQNVEKAKKLRKQMTNAEKTLWFKCLREFPSRVLRQRPIDRFIVDFYCPALKLVIEIDGDSHYTDDGFVSDKERTHVLEGYGLTVLRFTNREIYENLDGVIETLYKLAESDSEEG